MRLLTYFQADTTDFPTGSVCMQFEEFQWLDLFVDRCKNDESIIRLVFVLFCFLFCCFCLFVCFLERDSEREREHSNSKTVILKDSSFRSIWTYLTASL